MLFYLARGLSQHLWNEQRRLEEISDCNDVFFLLMVGELHNSKEEMGVQVASSGGWFRGRI